MYKALIVDNEPFIRTGIRDYLDWEKLGISTVYEAEDGLEALDVIDRLHPDLVITDIKMPGMDGLTLAKAIRERGLGTKIIILTGYPDFSFAQTAIRCDVVDFVLKPTKPSKIFEAVEKATALLREEERAKCMILSLETVISDSRSMLREKLLRDVLLRLSPAGESEDIDAFVLLLLALTHLDGGADRPEDGIERLKNITSMTFRGSSHIPIALDASRLCVILPLDGDDPSRHMHRVMVAGEEIASLPDTSLSFNLSVALSNLHAGLAELPDAYEECLSALNNRFYEQNSVCLCIPGEKRAAGGGVEPFLSDILKAVKAGKSSTAERLLETFIAGARSERLPIDQVKNAAALLYSLCFKLVPSDEDAIADHYDLYGRLFDCVTIGELGALLKREIASICQQTQHTVEINNSIIQTTLQFISEHYHENIKLYDIARNAHVNGSYLSRLFKKVMGETITETITRTRINKARELLLGTDLKSYEIASRVGIEDAAYFSILFKKQTGMSPRQYKTGGEE